jgi:hypothetical protein
VPETCAIYEDEDLVDLNKPRGAIFDWALAHHQELFPCIAWIKISVIILANSLGNRGGTNKKGERGK